MRIIPFRDQMNNCAIRICNSVMVRITQYQNTATCGQIDVSVRMRRQIHRLSRPFEKHRRFITSAVTICILKPKNSVMLETLIVIRREVGMTFDYQNFPILSDSDARRR